MVWPEHIKFLKLNKLSINLLNITYRIYIFFSILKQQTPVREQNLCLHK